MSHAASFAHPMKLNISTRNTVKFYLFNAIKKMLDFVSGPTNL